METSRCVDCGVVIGGNDHRAAPGSQILQPQYVVSKINVKICTSKEIQWSLIYCGGHVSGSPPSSAKQQLGSGPTQVSFSRPTLSVLVDSLAQGSPCGFRRELWTSWQRLTAQKSL